MILFLPREMIRCPIASARSCGVNPPIGAYTNRIGLPSTSTGVPVFSIAALAPSTELFSFPSSEPAAHVTMKILRRAQAALALPMRRKPLRSCAANDSWDRTCCDSTRILETNVMCHCTRYDVKFTTRDGQERTVKSASPKRVQKRKTLNLAADAFGGRRTGIRAKLFQPIK